VALANRGFGLAAQTVGLDPSNFNWQAQKWAGYMYPYARAGYYDSKPPGTQLATMAAGFVVPMGNFGKFGTIERTAVGTEFSAAQQTGKVIITPRYDVNTPWYQFLKPSFDVKASVVTEGRTAEAIAATKAHEGQHIMDVIANPQLTYLATQARIGKAGYFPGSGLARYWFEYRGYSAGGTLNNLTTPLQSFRAAQKTYLWYDLTLFGGGSAGAASSIYFYSSK